MPIPSRRAGEDRDSFISRCVSELNVLEESNTQAQNVAICYAQLHSSFSNENQAKSNNEKFYDWDACISDMKSQGYSENVAEKICGSIKARQ